MNNQILYYLNDLLSDIYKIKMNKSDHAFTNVNFNDAKNYFIAIEKLLNTEEKKQFEYQIIEINNFFNTNNFKHGSYSYNWKELLIILQNRQINDFELELKNNKDELKYNKNQQKVLSILNSKEKYLKKDMLYLLELPANLNCTLTVLFMIASLLLYAFFGKRSYEGSIAAAIFIISILTLLITLPMGAIANCKREKKTKELNYKKQTIINKFLEFYKNNNSVENLSLLNMLYKIDFYKFNDVFLNAFEKEIFSYIDFEEKNRLEQITIKEKEENENIIIVEKINLINSNR